MININLEDIDYYCLTILKNEKRRDNILKMKLKNLNFCYAPPKKSNYRSATTGLLKILTSIDTNNFKPFVILEDDVSLLDKLPTQINIPKNSDLVYLGISSQGWNNGFQSSNITTRLIGLNINNELVKIFNMLSTHAILINSKRGLNLYKRCMLESFIKNIPWDIPIVNKQKYYNVYAFKTPIFYQDWHFFGHQVATKIKLVRTNFNTFKGVRI